ncbi:hypothetical protein ABNX41_11080 [Rhodobacteraceae bacterium PA1-206B]
MIFIDFVPIVGVALFAFGAGAQKMIYTTNAVGSPNRMLGKILKTKSSFPTEEASTKLIYPAARNF